MKKVILILICLGVVSCNKRQTNKELVFTVNAVRETTPVVTADDAADDACIWIHPENTDASLIIGTNKKEGLCVYNLNGDLLHSYPVGKVNNVDIRANFSYQGNNISVVTASNRTNNTISIHKVNTDTTLENIALEPLTSKLQEVYGLCMYQNKNNTYVFVSGKNGDVEKWKLIAKENGVVGELITTISLGTQVEGMVADDELQAIYIAEEDVALWKYDSENFEQDKRVLIAKTTDVNMRDDFEGVTLYKQENNTGYVILSSQGNNSYAVFDRVTNKYLKSFKIEDGATIDGTYDTDGIDVTSVSFTGFSKGFFIAQDGDNSKGNVKSNQNFKLVDFNDILKGLE